MAELLANSPTAGERKPVGELAAALTSEATGANALKLKATIAKQTGLVVAGEEARVIIDKEIIRFKTAASGTEYEITERGAEETTPAAHAENAQVFCEPTKDAVKAFVAGRIVVETAEYVIKTGTQTITGKKTFEPAALAPEEESPAKDGEAALNMVAQIGAESLETGNAVSGKGGELKFSAARGGTGKTGLTSTKGGTGGPASISGGAGGPAITPSGADNKGGSTSKVTLVGGSGGAAEGSGTGKRTGGGGSEVYVTAGTGGLATGGTEGQTRGGAGGPATIEGGAGGKATDKKGIPGGGGGVIIRGGPAGEGGEEETPAAAGPVEVFGGKATSDALSGVIVFKTGKSATERLKITGAGVIEAKGEIKGEAATFSKTLKVAEASTLEGNVEAKKALTVLEGVKAETTLKVKEGIEGEKLKVTKAVEGETVKTTGLITAGNGLTVTEGTVTLPEGSIKDAAVEAFAWKAIETLSSKLKEGTAKPRATFFAGQVFLCGWIETKEECAAKTIIFKLPAGCRPEVERKGVPFGSALEGKVIPVNIKTTGEVETILAIKTTAVEITLDGVNFPLKG